MGNFGSKEDILSEIEGLFKKMNSGKLTLDELEDLVSLSRELHERSVILRYKAFEEKVFGERPVVASVTQLEEKESESGLPEEMEEATQEVEMIAVGDEMEEEGEEGPAFEIEVPAKSEPVFGFSLFGDEPEGHTEKEVEDTLSEEPVSSTFSNEEMTEEEEENQFPSVESTLEIEELLEEESHEIIQGETSDEEVASTPVSNPLSDQSTHDLLNASRNWEQKEENKEFQTEPDNRFSSETEHDLSSEADHGLSNENDQGLLNETDNSLLSESDNGLLSGVDNGLLSGAEAKPLSEVERAHAENLARFFNRSQAQPSAVEEPLVGVTATFEQEEEEVVEPVQEFHSESNEEEALPSVENETVETAPDFEEENHSEEVEESSYTSQSFYLEETPVGKSGGLIFENKYDKVNSELSESQFGLVKLDSLLGSFGLNERLQFINELFDGSSEGFSNAIKHLDQQASSEQARSKVAEYAIENNWDIESETVVEFMQKIIRRYA